MKINLLENLKIVHENFQNYGMHLKTNNTNLHSGATSNLDMYTTNAIFQLLLEAYAFKRVYV